MIDKFGRSIRILALLLAFLFLIPFGQYGSNDEFETDGLSDQSTGNTILHTGSRVDGSTPSIHLSSDDPDWIVGKKDVNLHSGNHFRLDGSRYVEKTRIPASPQSTYLMQSSRSSAVVDGVMLLAYIQTSVSPLGHRFMLSGSVDDGDSWTDEEVLFIEGVTTSSVELKVHEDKIFYAASTLSGSLPDIYVTVTPLVNWMNISSVEPVDLIHAGSTEGTMMVGFTDGLLLFSKESGYRTPCSFRYSNGTWSDPSFFNFPTYSYSPSVIEVGNNEEIIVQYILGMSSDAIYRVRSQDSGYTWSSPGVIGTGLGRISSIVSISTGSDVHTALRYTYIDSIGYYCYKGQTDVDVEKIFSAGSNGIDSNDKEITIGMGKDVLSVVCEDQNGDICIGRSFDGGSSFEKVRFGSTSAHSPSVSSDMSLIIFMNGTDLQVGKTSVAGSGHIISKPVFVNGLDSWDSIGFSLGGASNEDSFSVIFADSHGNRIYPSEGMISVHDSTEGYIEGKYYQHIMDLSPLNDGDPPDEIVLELYFSSGSNEDPSLFSIMINFHVSYPYEHDIVDGRSISLTSGTGVSEVGLELIPGYEIGSAIVGPFFVGNQTPHHLLVKGNFLAEDNYCTFELIGSDPLSDEPLLGFQGNVSGRLNVSEDYLNIKWGLKNLGDIPPSVNTFHIRVIFTGTGVISPRLSSIKIIYSTSPVIENVEISEGEIYRDSETRMNIYVNDEEDPMDHLLLDVQVQAPDEIEWFRAGLIDPIWNLDHWEVGFITTPFFHPGNYSFRITASDRIGLQSDPYLCSDFLDVMNNLPSPPMVKITPEDPRSGDHFSIEMLEPGIDLETDQSLLGYNVYLIGNGVDIYTRDNLSTADTTFDEVACLKGDIWEIVVRTWDGLEEGVSVSQAISIPNSDPVRSLVDLEISIEEDNGMVSYDLTEDFDDIDMDELTFTVNAPTQISPVVEDGIVDFNLEVDYHGESWMEVEVSDDMASILVNYSVIVSPVNDHPEWNTVEDVVVDENDWVFVDIGARDERDDEIVDVGIGEFTDGLIEGKNIMYYPNGSFHFKPDNDMIGKHGVDVEIDDGVSPVTFSFNLTVFNVNQPPEIPTITITEGKRLFTFGDPLTLNVAASDPDLKWGDDVLFYWESSLEGDLGNGLSISPQLGVGVHTITVTAVDSSDARNSTTIDIEIHPEESGSEDVMRTWLMYTLSGVISLMIGLILAILVAVLFFRLRSKDEKKEEGSQSNEKVDIPDKPAGPGLPSSGGQPQLASSNMSNDQMFKSLPPVQETPVTPADAGSNTGTGVAPVQPTSMPSTPAQVTATNDPDQTGQQKLNDPPPGGV